MTERIAEAEALERMRLLAGELEKLVRAHTDSLGAADAAAMALGALGRVLAEYMVVGMRVHLRGQEPSLGVVLARLQSYPWLALVQDSLRRRALGIPLSEWVPFT